MVRPLSMQPRAIAARIRRELAPTSCTYLSHTISLRADGTIVVAHGYGSVDPEAIAEWSCNGSRDWPTPRQIATAIGAA